MKHDDLLHASARCWQRAGHLDRAAERFAVAGTWAEAGRCWAEAGRHVDAAEAYGRADEPVFEARQWLTSPWPERARRPYRRALEAGLPSSDEVEALLGLGELEQALERSFGLPEDDGQRLEALRVLWKGGWCEWTPPAPTKRSSPSRCPMTYGGSRSRRAAIGSPSRILRTPELFSECGPGGIRVPESCCGKNKCRKAIRTPPAPGRRTDGSWLGVPVPGTRTSSQMTSTCCLQRRNGVFPQHTRIRSMACLSVRTGVTCSQLRPIELSSYVTRGLGRRSHHLGAALRR